MGATNFIHEIKARNPKEAFEELIAAANNGSINTCDLGRCTKKFDKFNDTNMNKAVKYIQDNGYGEKWTANYVEVGISHYLVTTVKKKNVEEVSKKLRIMYTVYSSNVFSGYCYTGKIFKNKTEADKYAVEQTLKDDEVYIVKKEYVALDNKSNIVSKTYKEVKTYKTKPKLKSLPNRKIEAVKQYIFYGWASC